MSAGRANPVAVKVKPLAVGTAAAALNGTMIGPATPAAPTCRCNAVSWAVVIPVTVRVMSKVRDPGL